MFINDVNRKEEIQNIAILHLRKHGIKYRPKKIRPTSQVPRYGKKLFKVPLQNLETETVTLTNGQQLIIPKRIHEMCSYILSKVQTEGIFRKEGSKSRQHEIKLSLDRGCLLGDEHHVIDVAVVLKSFLRELPEPLIPLAFNDLFLMCSLEKRSREDMLQCLLLACLLLPSENLNVLSYLMQFFYEVASFSVCNKMSFSNLSILVGPNIFPMDDKLAPKSSFTITRICHITRLLIENSRSIGVIPDYIIDQIGQASEAEIEKRRKNKRRSGSLTRMLNNLKKIVTSKNEDDSGSGSSYAVAPDLLLTPTIHASVKKRKGESGLSLKKKKEVLAKLPDCAVLTTPFTPSRTPVSVNPNGKKIVEDQDGLDNVKEKKMHWYMRSRSMKSLKEDDSINSSGNNTRRNSLGPKSLLERRWSAVSNAANFRKKKRNSCAATKKELAVVKRKEENSRDEPDYVRVPKTEYEEFKNRISAIERRISIELDNVQAHMDSDNDNNVNQEINDEHNDMIENVQTAYEKTLETGSMSPTTDQLARRLSRDLKIRRSAEQKIIRSPSARKIGTLRRRSTEREKKNAQIVRNQSWHVGKNAVKPTNTAPLLPRVSIRRKKHCSSEDAIISQMNLEPQITPPPDVTNQAINVRRSSSYQNSSSVGRGSRNSITQVSGTPCLFAHRSSSQGDLTVELSDSGVLHSTNYSASTSSENWVSADGFLNSTSQTKQDAAASGNARASIAKLRSQNIGMVRAKARLFDNLKDSDTSCSPLRSASRSQPGSGKRPSRNGGRSGSAKSVESTRMSYRIKILRSEERRNKKNSISPRRRCMASSQKQRLQYIGKQYLRCSKDVSNTSMELAQDCTDLSTPRKDLKSLDATVHSPRRTPRHHNMPYIKVPPVVKTPKRLCRTPLVDKRTPFKIVATPK